MDNDDRPTMTVAELAAALQIMPQDAELRVSYEGDARLPLRGVHVRDVAYTEHGRPVGGVVLLDANEGYDTDFLLQPHD